MEKKLTNKQDQKKPYQDLIQARKESKQKANPTAEKAFEWLNENSKNEDCLRKNSRVWDLSVQFLEWHL
jgi:hypothetical protein